MNENIALNDPDQRVLSSGPQIVLRLNSLTQIDTQKE